MKRVWLTFSIFWVAVTLVYFMSAFDGVHSERLYSIFEIATLPTSAITGNVGIALEGRYSLTPITFLLRILLDLALPALIDFGLIYGAHLIWKKIYPNAHNSVGPPEGRL